LSTIRQKLEELLHEFERRAEIAAAAVVRRDGLMIAYDLPTGVDARKIAAMAAAIVGTAERATYEMGQGRFQIVMIEGEKGRMVAMGAGEKAILLALLRPEANVGLVLLEMERTAKQVQETLRG